MLAHQDTKDMTPGLCSIVIPVFNQVELTRPCLDALRQTIQGVPYEVVVVDNASSDGTPELLATLESPFQSIRNEENLGFARACNQGAMAAQGEYLLFLNNDTSPLPKWLAPMLRCLEEFPDAGIIGSKLLFPQDELVQHAGIVITRNCLAYHVYSGFPSNSPEVNVRRAYPAVTGACLLVRRTLYNLLEGFDEVFLNGFEDVDFCLRARELGYKSVYCPDSALYHYTSMTEGRNAYDRENLAVFCKRWTGKIEGVLSVQEMLEGMTADRDRWKMSYRRLAGIFPLNLLLWLRRRLLGIPDPVEEEDL